MNGHLPVVGILRASGPVGTYIGGSGLTTARVFIGDPPPTAAYPRISVDIFDSEAFDTKSGPAYIDHDMVKVFCEAGSETGESVEATAYQLSREVRAALEAQQGTFNGVYIENIRFLRESTYDVDLTNRRVRVHEHDYEVRTRVTNT